MPTLAGAKHCGELSRRAGAALHTRRAAEGDIRTPPADYLDKVSAQYVAAERIVLMGRIHDSAPDCLEFLKLFLGSAGHR
jgi:hypothetical protein